MAQSPCCTFTERTRNFIPTEHTIKKCIKHVYIPRKNTCYPYVPLACSVRQSYTQTYRHVLDFLLTCSGDEVWLSTEWSPSLRRRNTHTHTHTRKTQSERERGREREGGRERELPWLHEIKHIAPYHTQNKGNLCKSQGRPDRLHTFGTRAHGGFAQST
jgi:hypothetical protein